MNCLQRHFVENDETSTVFHDFRMVSRVICNRISLKQQRVRSSNKMSTQDKTVEMEEVRRGRGYEVVEGL